MGRRSETATATTGFFLRANSSMQETVLQESQMMIPQTMQRLEAAFADLEAFIKENQQDIAETEELKAAKEMIEQVAPSIKS